jgi:alpha-glucosidase
MRRVLDSYPGDRMAVGEAWVADAERLARYVRPDEFNLAFNFELLERPWDAAQFRTAVAKSLDALASVGAMPTWVLENHDVERAVTRYGSLARARAAALMLLSLPGAAYVYNGEELGLPHVDVPRQLTKDRQAVSRDGARVPMPWSGAEPPYGFSSTAQTWLPMPAGWGPLSVEAQHGDPDSTLELYRKAIRRRREFLTAPFAWVDAPPGCLAYQRGDVRIVLNAGAEPVALPAGEIVLASGPLRRSPATSGPELPPDTAVWIDAT